MDNREETEELFLSKFRSFKNWMSVMNKIIQITSLLDIQDEKDKQSLSLIGLKERIHSPNNSRKHLYTNQHQNIGSPKSPMCKIDPKCLTCCSNQLEK